MAKIGITETVLRDAHQSLIATRMRTDEFEGILEKMDKIGYHSLECLSVSVVSPIKNSTVNRFRRSVICLGRNTGIKVMLPRPP